MDTRWCYACGQPGAFKPVEVSSFGIKSKVLYCYKCWLERFPQPIPGR